MGERRLVPLLDRLSSQQVRGCETRPVVLQVGLDSKVLPGLRQLAHQRVVDSDRYSNARGSEAESQRLVLLVLLGPLSLGPLSLGPLVFR